MSSHIAPDGRPPSKRRLVRLPRLALYGFLSLMALIWIFPLAWAIYTALRPFSDTQLNGYISLPSQLTFDNFINAWNQGEFARHFLSTLIVTVPAVIVTLILASMVAFAVSRFSWRFNLFVLLVFTAGNLLPPQVIIVPLFKLYNAVQVIPPAAQRQRAPVRPVLRPVRDQHRVPARLLHLRAQQLHEDDLP